MKEKVNRFCANMRFMLRRSWQLSRSIYLSTAIQSIIAAVQPFVMLLIPKYILDELAGQRRPNITLGYIAIYAAAIVLFNTANVLIGRYESLRSIECAHRAEMYEQKKWLYMDYENFENGQVRELAERSVGQLDPASFIKNTVFGFISGAVQLAGYTYIITSLHPLVTIIILAVIGANTLIARRLNKIGYEYQPLLTRFSRRYAYIFDMMLGIRGGQELRINGASKWLLKKYDRETAEYLKIFEENRNKQLGCSMLTLLIDLVQTVVIYGYCSYLAISGGISIGSFTVFLGAVTAFTGSFGSFIRRFPELQLLSRYVDDYREYLRIAEHSGRERETVSGDDPTNGRFDIEFVDVSFKYPGTDRFVLKNINIRIKDGERLSIVGYNGAGKSTFIKLLCRLYEPTDGKILVGGIDISTISSADYRKLLAVVFQDHQLFWFSTVRENIVLGNEYNEELFADAVEKSGLAAHIAPLKKGFDTILECVYDEGIRFSGGEEQKLACTRAYYRDAPIVILDEPTASLDPLAEAGLYERFNSIIGKKTSIYISHRLSSVKFCDSVAVFADGEIVERGTHEELMKKNGIYADMFGKQAHYYITEDASEEVST